MLSSCPPKLAQLSVARRAELLWKALKVYALVTGLQPDGDDAHRDALLGGADDINGGRPVGPRPGAPPPRPAWGPSGRAPPRPKEDDLGLGWLGLACFACTGSSRVVMELGCFPR